MLQTKARVSDLHWTGDPDDLAALLSVVDAQLEPFRDEDLQHRTRYKRSSVSSAERMLKNEPSKAMSRLWEGRLEEAQRALEESAEKARASQSLRVTLAERNGVTKMLWGNPSDVVARTDPRIVESITVEGQVSEPHSASISISFRRTMGVSLSVSSSDENWTDSAHFRIYEEIKKCEKWWQRGNSVPNLVIVIGIVVAAVSTFVAGALMPISDMSSATSLGVLFLVAFFSGLIGAWVGMKLFPGFAFHRRGHSAIGVRALSVAGALVISIAAGLIATFLR